MNLIQELKMLLQLFEKYKQNNEFNKVAIVSELIDITSREVIDKKIMDENTICNFINKIWRGD